MPPRARDSRADDVAGAKGFAAMPHSPLATSSMVTQVTGRIASPSTLTMASVSLSMIASFSAAAKTPSMSFTWMRGMVPPGWFGWSAAADRREMSLGQEVHHQLIEVVWALQRHHV